MESPPPFRIIIIGGGVAGLALAQLLRNDPTISVTVYEKRAADTPENLTGYRVMISSFVLRNLKAQLPASVWNAVCQSIGVHPPHGQEMKFVQSQGRELCTWFPKEMRDQFSVSRTLFTEGMLQDSDDFVYFGKPFQKFTRHVDGTVGVTFEDGTEDHCDLLVGADGFGSRVRRQLIPESKIVDTGVVVIYFKIPLTPETMEAAGTISGKMIFCSHNQNLILHSWQNPDRLFSENYSDRSIAPLDSFIMFGYGSPVSQFINRRCPPAELSNEELKEEILLRTKSEKNMHPNFVALAEKCLVDTAYVHVVKKCDVVSAWNDGQVTLIGDAVFNMATTLGKGANCALLDAIALAETLTLTPLYKNSSPASSIYSQPRSSYEVTRTRRTQLYKFAQDNVSRRLEERSRSAILQNLFYFGEGKLKAYVRDKGLDFMLKWVERPS